MSLRWFLRCLLLGLAFVFLLSLELSTTFASPQSPPRAPLFAANAADKIAGQYIIVFKGDTREPAMRQVTERAATTLGGTVLYEYRAALQGFAAKLDKKAVRQLRKNPRIAFIEQDKRVSINDRFDPGISPSPLDTAQPNATWGLDRIDQRNLPLDNVYNYVPNGTGVNAYVIDTGIRITHTDFGGRAYSGYDAIGDGNGTNDCNGHGTHVAGTIGSATYGVAKNVKLYAVRVLGCDGYGSNSGVIAGIDWITQNRVKPAVSNMSLGGGTSTALDNAVRNSINAGVVFAVAAGNESVNACNSSPARTAEAITVGATTSTDARASYSNYGTCLDLFAPGSSIQSTWNSSDTATNTISGTSMATPHVAGVVALYLQNNPNASASAVRDAVVNNATPNKVSNAGSGSPNLLLYSIFGAAPSPTDTPIPTPTHTPTPQPGGTNVIVNPGFESGPNSGWAQSSNGGYQVIDTTRPHTGSYSAYFCNYNTCTEYVEQTIKVPANAALTYWWYQTSKEGTAKKYDLMRVRLYTTNGALVKNLRKWSNKSKRGVWSQDTISLAAYAGQTLKLRFVATTDATLPSAYFVDDVSVQ